MGAGKNRSANRKTLSIVDGLIKSKTCAKQPLEIYSKMYYTSRIKPDSPVDMTDATDTNISTFREQIKKKFRVEPQEIQDKVMRIYSEQTTGTSTSKSAPAAEAAEEINRVTDMEVRTRSEFAHHSVAVVLTI